MKKEKNEEIEQNGELKKSKYKKISIFFVCIEILVLGFMRFAFMCNCGYSFYNTIISKVVVVIQIIVNFVLDKLIIRKNKYLLLVINIVLIFAFFIGLKLMPNDMEKLHSISIGII